MTTPLPVAARDGSTRYVCKHGHAHEFMCFALLCEAGMPDKDLEPQPVEAQA